MSAYKKLSLWFTRNSRDQYNNGKTHLHHTSLAKKKYDMKSVNDSVYWPETAGLTELIEIQVQILIQLQNSLNDFGQTAVGLAHFTEMRIKL